MAQITHWLCIRLPRLPLEVFTRSCNKQQVLAVCDHRRHSSVLFCNALAQQAGICSGMSVAASRALSQSLFVKLRNYPAEEEALRGLAAWAYQFSSQVSLYPPDALLLEVRGSFKLFGGYQSLLERIRSESNKLGYKAQLAGAPTPLAAFSLVRCELEKFVENLHQLPTVLSPLPLSVLDWEQSLLDRLQGMGVHSLGALLKLPRDGLARRFGPENVSYLDRMLGRQPDIRALYQPPAHFRRRLLLPAEVVHAAALLFSLQRLLMELCGWLRGFGAGIQQLNIGLWHREQRQTRLSIEVKQSSRDIDQFTLLLRERLERLQLVEPVLEVELQAEQLQVLDARTEDLFDARHGQRQVDLLDHLRARLGDAAVKGLRVVEEHRPEYAWRYSNPSKNESDKNKQDISEHLRPLWLLPTPRLLKTKDGWPYLQGRLTLQSGRERIQSGWWDDCAIARDYFIGSNVSGAEYWIYREISKGRCWFLQGVFE